MLYKFPCGCQWPILEDGTLDFDVDRAPENCPATWELIGKGLTKGVFQLESQLGRSWARKLKPENLEHITALGSILRPGCLEAVDDEGVSITAHYCKRKNKQEELPPAHPMLERILAPTYGSVIFQEQILEIAKELAGFSLVDADLLRRAMGKKSTEAMAKCREMFINGAERVGHISKEEATRLFDDIEKSQRYLFNKCIAGDEIIARLRYPNLPVEVMYHIRNDEAYAKEVRLSFLHEQWKNAGNYGLGFSIHEGSRRPNIIEDIQPAGVREVFKITTVNGLTIRATGNHKFPTVNAGEMTVDEMRETNGFPPTRLYFIKDGEVSTAAVASIESDGEAETFDVTMAAPYHNFVLENGLVTCNSHACCYGITGYETAYIKAHFPLAFFAAWLKNARDKQDPRLEIYELVNDSKLFDVTVTPPDLRSPLPDFHVDGELVRFGLSNIKGVGTSQVEKIQKAISELEVPIDRLTWYEFITKFAVKISPGIMVKLIECGAVSWYDMTRQAMLAEFAVWNELTEKEQAWMIKQEGLSSLEEALEAGAKMKKEGGACATKNRVLALLSHLAMLRKPPTALVDSPHWLSHAETELLGVSLTCSKIDGCDISAVNCTCKEYIAGRKGFMIFGVEITNVREIVTKKGNKMAFLSITDGTCSLEDVVCFPEAWEEFSSCLLKGNTVIIQGERDSRKESGTLIVKKVWQAN